MDIREIKPNEIDGIIKETSWLYWDNVSRAYYGPCSDESWKEAWDHADHVLAIGVTKTVELRRLEDRGWCGRVGENPSRDAMRFSCAGHNSLKELRLDAEQWARGNPRPLRMDHGMFPGSHQVVWLPFIAETNE